MNEVKNSGLLNSGDSSTTEKTIKAKETLGKATDFVNQMVGTFDSKVQSRRRRML